MDISSALLSRVEESEWRSNFANRRALSTQGAFRNRVYCTNPAPAITTPNAASNIIFAIAQITAKVSGIFQASVSVNWTDASGAHAAADAYTFNLQTQTGTGAVTISNSAAITQGGVGSIFLSNNAAGMSITAGGGGTLTVTSQSIQAAATASNFSGIYAWSGILQNAAASLVETPFPIGNNVFLLFGLNATAHVPSLSFLEIELVEQP